MSVKITFLKVGRAQTSWIAELPNAKEQTIWKHIDAQRVFPNRNFKVLLDDEGQGIIEDGVYVVGLIRIEAVTHEI